MCVVGVAKYFCMFRGDISTEAPGNEFQMNVLMKSLYICLRGGIEFPG